MTSKQQQWEQLWQAIEQAGGRYQYVLEQMKKNGFFVERKAIDKMSASERERYKKQLKKESEEQKTLQQQAWQAYKANHIVHLGQGIYWSDDTSEDQWDVKDGAKRLLENQLPVFNNVKALADSLKLTIPQLKGLAFHREVATKIAYQRFTIAKKSGGEREIWAPIPRLKNAQRWILDNILHQLPTHGSAHGFIQGKSIKSNAEIHTNSEWIIKLDIKDFFPSINWRRVKGVYRQAGYPEQIATLLALLCTESPRQAVKQNNSELLVALAERCLPQGSPASPALTNIICVNLDKRLTGLADKHGLRYSRYADDLTFSLPKNIDKKAEKTPETNEKLIATIIGSVAKILQEEGFNLHHKKTKIIRQSNRQQVTGLVVNNDKARTPRELKRLLRASIHNLQQGKALKQGENLDTLRGYASFVAMTEPDKGKQFLRQLNAIEKIEK